MTAYSKVWIVLLLVLVGYSLLCVGMWLFQERLLLAHYHLPEETKYQFEGLHEEMMIDLDHETRINAVLIRQKAPRGLIIYVRGNAGVLPYQAQTARKISDHTNYDVFLWDYRTLWKSRGRYQSDSDFYDETRALYDRIVPRYMDKPLVIMGRSLGSGIATNLAATRPHDALILETPYDSIQSLAAEQYPWLPVKYILRYPFFSSQFFAQLSTPVLILHGTADALIPYEHARSLFTTRPSTTRFVTLSEWRHNNLSEFPLYWESIDLFLTDITLTHS